MITTTIEWHKPTEKLPAKSGDYLVIYAIYNKKASLMVMGYSSKHKLFNTYDWEDKPEGAVHALYWAEKPVFPEKI